MSYLFTNVIFVLFIIYFLRTNIHGLHMLQLEHYYKDRYLKWMKENSRIVFNFKKIVLLLISSAVFLFGYVKIAIVLTIITYILFIITIPYKKAKKPFVITKRVKRQF